MHAVCCCALYDRFGEFSSAYGCFGVRAPNSGSWSEIDGRDGAQSGSSLHRKADVLRSGSNLPCGIQEKQGESVNLLTSAST